MRYSRTGEGMHRFTDPTDGETYVYTQLFMDDVQRVFAAFDQPDLKAVFELTVTAPEGWTVLANGITERQDERQLAGRPTPLISTYLVAVAAGPWHSVRTEHRGLPFGIHCRRSLAPYLDTDADEILDITRACYDRYHEKFEEPYPFDSYDQAFVPEFNAGAMENPGLVTFRDEFVYRSAVTDTERQTRAMVIAHEMAHMWFGDLVTLRWWDDIWLNESFAEYMGYQTLTEATRFTDTWTDFGIVRKAWGYDADQRPSTHPVAPDPEAVPDTASAMLNFDGISYAKGASALRQLVAWLGEKDFLAGINTHFARHRFANATLADFIESLAAATERDVHAWADSWLRTTGVDTLTASVTAQPGEWTLTLDRAGSRPHRVTVGVYDRDLNDNRALLLRERYETRHPATARPRTPHRPPPRPRRPQRPRPHLRQDPPRRRVLPRPPCAASPTSPTPSPAPSCGTPCATWSATATSPPPPTWRPPAPTSPRRGDLAVVQGVLTFATTQVADRYLPAHERPAALATLTSLCRDLIRRTEDGDHPGLRLIAVRHLIDVAAQPDTISAWLSEGTVPGGPELDPELRWRILGRLAVLGAIDDAVIDAELVQDPSATGQEGAARCRAALPDPAAKRAAWESMFTTDDLSNYLFIATAQGFWQPEQTDLVREYVDLYWTDAVAVAARRGPAIAEAAGRWAFPAYAITPETLQAGEQCLTRRQPHPRPPPQTDRPTGRPGTGVASTRVVEQADRDRTGQGDGTGTD
jgi:aminopeptidase N